MLPFSIPAGLPKTTSETEIAWLDLNEYVGSRDNGIVYVEIEGNSMIDEQIFDGDLVVVDRIVEPIPGDVIIARIGEDYTIKKYKRDKKHLYLVPANCKFKTKEIFRKDDFEIFGVVRWVLHKRR